MKPELSKENQIIEAVEEVKVAMLADLKANQKLEEVNREKTATRYAVQKARQRLSDIEI